TMSISTTKASKATVLAQLQALVSGLQAQLPNGSFTVASTEYTTATLVQTIQVLIDALTAVDAAHAALKTALVVFGAADVKVGPVVQGTKHILRTMYSNAPSTLHVFGLPAPKARAPRTAEQRVLSAAKAKATREARGTTSKKQKAAITGNVTGVTIVPNVAPPAVPQPVTPATDVPPTGHAGS
ncbi:MAG TPA: hypothetical protein VIY73_24970, partial [Polyangiaceae bacterium]